MPDFKIAAAQVASVRGDIDRNIATHAAAIVAAAGQAVSVIVFPELSLAGYEPDLAAELAMTADDSRLAPLVELARRHCIAVVAGAPLRNGTAKPFIGAIVISTDGIVKTYRKMHLGTTEKPYFVAGDAPLALEVAGHTLGVAICADTSQRSHPQTYAERGADIYAAGVLLTAEWYGADSPRLADYAAQFRILTVMTNHAASIGTHVSVGKSAIWAPGGQLLVQASGTENALLIATSSNGSWRGEVVKIG